jgi:hypothetical protein
VRIVTFAALAALILGLSSAQATSSRPWCEAARSQAWRTALARSVVPLSRRVSLVAVGAPRDGHRFFAELYSKTFSGIAEVDTRTGRYRPIHRFAHLARDQAVGSFGGRWLVWQELHTFDLAPRDFDLWAYDTRTRAVRRIGASAPDLWPSPGWRAPDVRGGYAVWAQGSGPDGLADVHVYDLAAGKDRVVRHGHAQNPFLISGHRVAWPESASPGALTRIRVAGAATGAALPVPVALRPLRGVYAPATDGNAIAYSASRDRTLWWSPSLRRAPRRVFRTRGVETVDNSLQISGRYVFFGVQPRSYVADASTGRYVSIGAGWSRMSSVGLVVQRPSAGKASHAIADVDFLRRASFPPVPRC